MQIGSNTYELVNDKYYKATFLYQAHPIEVILETSSPLVAGEIGDYVGRLLEDLPSILKRAEKSLLDSVNIGYHERMQIQKIIPSFLLLIRPDQENYVEFEFGFSLHQNLIVDSEEEDLFILLGGNSMSEKTVIEITGDIL